MRKQQAVVTDTMIFQEIAAAITDKPQPAGTLTPQQWAKQHNPVLSKTTSERQLRVAFEAGKLERIMWKNGSHVTPCYKVKR